MNFIGYCFLSPVYDMTAYFSCFSAQWRRFWGAIAFFPWKSYATAISIQNVPIFVYLKILLKKGILLSQIIQENMQTF